MLTLEQVSANLNQMKSILLTKQAEKNVIQKQLATIGNDLKEVKTNLDIDVQSRELLSKAIREAREEAKYIIENLVTRALVYVFESDIEFKVNITEHKTYTDCDFIILENGEELDPVESNGGGIIDIVSFILRIALIQATNSIKIEDKDTEDIPNNGPLILDEPFKHLSEGYIDKMASFLIQLTEQLDMQIILTTHNKALLNLPGKKFRVTQTNKVSKVEDITDTFEAPQAV